MVLSSCTPNITFEDTLSQLKKTPYPQLNSKKTVSLDKDYDMFGPSSIRYWGGTARNDFSCCNAMALGLSVLVGSITAITVSVKSVAPISTGRLLANRCAVYRGHGHAADLTHSKDTTVAGPSAPMVMANTVPSSP